MKRSSRRVTVRLLACCAILACSENPVAVVDDVNVAGNWNVEQFFLENTGQPAQQPFLFAVYEWNLTQTGQSVTGAITEGPRGGTITGTMDGDTFTGTMQLQFDPVPYSDLSLEFDGNTASGIAEYSPPQSSETHRYSITLSRVGS